MTGLWRRVTNRLAELGFAAERAANGVARKALTADGEHRFYLEGGSAKAETILMLHGFTANKDNWTRFCGTVAKRYRVVAPDLPGFGESARHKDWSYALDEQRERLAAFVRALGLVRFHIVGSSMGGHLAALYAHARPGEVVSLALFNNAGVTAKWENEMYAALARSDNLLLARSVEDFDRVLDFVAHKKPFVPWPARRYLAERAVEDRDFFAMIFAQYRRDLDEGLEKTLPEIRTPTLVLWGRQDRVLDVSCVEAMRPLLPHAEVIVMEETGHLPMLERPALAARHYLSFAEKHH